MWSVHRSVLAVRPRQPYLDRVHSLDEGGQKSTLEDLRQDGTSYLVPQLEDEAHKDEILADFYEEVFEHELWGSMRDPNVWPRQRDLATFRAWFELEFCRVTLDLVGKPIEREEE